MIIATPDALTTLISSNFEAQSMSQFEFIFSLYSLVLGLSLVEILGGFGRTLKSFLHVDEEGKAKLTIGVLTPLLGLFVMLDLLSFWSAAWTVRNTLSVSGATLMGTMLFASAYYLAAHMVFPDNLAIVSDLDEHYFRVRKIVYAVLLALLLVQLGFYASNQTLAARLFEPTSLALTLGLIVLLIIACVAKSKPLNIAILLAMNLRYVFVYLL